MPRHIYRIGNPNRLLELADKIRRAEEERLAKTGKRFPSVETKRDMRPRSNGIKYEVMSDKEWMDMQRNPVAVEQFDDIDFQLDFGRRAQGYNDRLDESMGIRKSRRKSRKSRKSGKSGKVARKSVRKSVRKSGKSGKSGKVVKSAKARKSGKSARKSRRDESKGMEKFLGRRAYASVKTMDKKSKKRV